MRRRRPGTSASSSASSPPGLRRLERDLALGDRRDVQRHPHAVVELEQHRRDESLVGLVVEQRRPTISSTGSGATISASSIATSASRGSIVAVAHRRRSGRRTPTRRERPQPPRRARPTRICGGRVSSRSTKPYATVAGVAAVEHLVDERRTRRRPSGSGRRGARTIDVLLGEVARPDASRAPRTRRRHRPAHDSTARSTSSAVNPYRRTRSNSSSTACVDASRSAPSADTTISGASSPRRSSSNRRSASSNGASPRSASLPRRVAMISKASVSRISPLRFAPRPSPDRPGRRLDQRQDDAGESLRHVGIGEHRRRRLLPAPRPARRVGRATHRRRSADRTRP